jgi:hypothetical protein
VPWYTIKRVTPFRSLMKPAIEIRHGKLRQHEKYEL